MDSAANDLLENGIYVETSRGLVCMSLKDALTSGVGGLKLSVEDLQNIAQLLTQHPESVHAQLSAHSKPEEPDPQEHSDTYVVEASSQETDSGKETDTCYAPPPSLAQPAVQKRRGGWPKGRKRKPDLAETRPPKAPATGYVLYLNEKRKAYKEIPFTEVTKLLGAEWSRLSLQDKQPYLDQAEEDKKRYRRELKAYRQSSAYQEFLRKKRLKRQHGNRTTEESDMDATDEIEDDEDNEELYCRTCDQWFSSLHNKKEHLYGRTHLQAMAGDFQKERHSGQASSSTPLSTSLDESSLDGCPVLASNVPTTTKQQQHTSTDPSDVPSAMVQFFETYSGREKEVQYLELRLEESQAAHSHLVLKMASLKERETLLKTQLQSEEMEHIKLSSELENLLQVPSHFILSGSENAVLPTARGRAGWGSAEEMSPPRCNIIIKG